jgi:hypothetical protein
MPKSTKFVQCNIRLFPWVVDWFDDAATAEMSASPGHFVTRSDLMRRVLTEYVEAQRNPRPRPRSRRKGRVPGNAA